MRQQRARHHGRLLEGARQRGARVIARPERKRVRSLGLHTGFIGNPASGPRGGYARLHRCSRSTAATAPGPLTPWWARSTSSRRSATRSRWTRCTTRTCSSARAARARRRWRSCWPAPSTPRAARTPISTPRRPSAQAILAGTSLDVVEMDAASNNSVDDIRELRENVALAPMQGGKRVYILDEAHMLTTGRLERVPEDARGAARARGLRARHDRGAQGAGHDHRPLPPLRLPAPVARADRGRAAAGGRARRGSRSPTPPWGCSRARPPARSATRSARSSSSSRTAATR